MSDPTPFKVYGHGDFLRRCATQSQADKVARTYLDDYMQEGDALVVFQDVESEDETHANKRFRVSCGYDLTDDSAEVQWAPRVHNAQKKEVL